VAEKSIDMRFGRNLCVQTAMNENRENICENHISGKKEQCGVVYFIFKHDGFL
jgi:hypothetical protein